MLGKALKDELKKLLDGAQELTAKDLVQIERLASTGRALLMAAAGAPLPRKRSNGYSNAEMDMLYEAETVLGEDGLQPQPLVPGGVNESFGSKILRELMQMYPALIQAIKPKPALPNAVDLLSAIKIAETSGKPELARLLEAKFKEAYMPTGAVPYEATSSPLEATWAPPANADGLTDAQIASLKQEHEDAVAYAASLPVEEGGI